MQNLIKTLKKYDIFVYILAILLLLLIASFSFSSTEITNSPETTLAAPTNSDNWQSSSSSSYRDTSWSGSGTSDSPYLITSAQELAGLAYMVNSGNTYSGTYFRQTQDIDLSAHYWTPIGNSARRFQGNFNGDYYNISGLFTNTSSTDYVGLFGYIEKANISNLSLTSGSVLGRNYVGGMTGYSRDSKIQNCISNISVEATYQAGGIAGYSYNSDISNCVSTQSVSGRGNYIGGIVGELYLGNVSNCYNKGVFGAINSQYVGGIAGSARSAEIYYCANYSSVISLGHTGGITGYAMNATVSYCANEGNVLADDYLGGIIGEASTSQINNCYNIGDVLCMQMGTDNNNIYAGGIVGYTYCSMYTYDIYNCYNAGNVSTSYGNYLGGIAGYSNRSICNCFNLGEVYTIYGTQSTTGEIAGSSRGTYNCYTASQARPTDLSWFTNTSNWHSSYQWDFSSAWGLSSNYNNNYPYLRMLTYSVNYNLDETSSETLYCKWGTSYEFPVGATKDGYIFAGWTSTNLNRNYAKVGTSKANVYWDGSTTDASHFADLGSNGQTVTLTANWEEIQYDVQIEYNDGVTEKRTISDISYSTVFNVPNPTRTAYNFAGWSSSNKDNTALVGDSATSCTTSWTSGTTKATFFSKLTSTDGRTVILTANWEPKQYTITFDLDGGTGSTSMTYTINGNYTLPEPNKTGHTFTGWQFVSQSGEGNWSSGTYSAGTSLNGKYGNISLRATWRANTYTVTFDPQGGSVSPTTIQVTYGQPYGYHNNGVLPTPSRLDYNFETWATARFASGDYDSIFATDIYMIDGDSTLYAKWSTTWNIYAEKPEGNGTTASPYLISKPEHLGWLSYQVARGGQTTAVCKQTANINISQLVVGRVSPQWYPIGTLTYPFRGSYDGNGFNIWSGKYINVYTTNWGIFGCTNGAKLNRVYVTSSGDIDEDVVDFDLSIFQNTNIGGIIGYAWGSTTLTNCALSGRVATTINMTNKGALIGNATSSVTISDCVVFPLTTHDNSSLGISGGNPRIESCVYVINGVKGYTFTGYTDSTETNFVIADYLSAPVPVGLSWLAYGGERATLAEIKAWANS